MSRTAFVCGMWATPNEMPRAVTTSVVRIANPYNIAEDSPLAAALTASINSLLASDLGT